MNNSLPARPAKPAAETWFYSTATVALLALTVIGFQLFYFHGMAYPGRPLTPPIKTLVVTHAAAMSLWMILAVTQPVLIARGNRRLHMTLGKAGAVLAVAMVVLGVKLGIASCQVAPPGLMYGPLTPKQFMSVPVLDAVLFALFVTAGVLWRKRPAAHKPMMFLATLAAVAAAISRIDCLNHVYAGTAGDRLFGFFFFTVVAGAVFLVAKCVVFRAFDRWFAGGFAVLALWYGMATQIAPTPVWDAIAGALLR